MEKKNLISRRNVIKTSAMAAVGAAIGGCCESHRTGTSAKLGLNNAEKVGFLSSRVVIPVVIGITVVAVAAIMEVLLALVDFVYVPNAVKKSSTNKGKNVLQ